MSGGPTGEAGLARRLPGVIRFLLYTDSRYPGSDMIFPAHILLSGHSFFRYISLDSNPQARSSNRRNKGTSALFRCYHTARLLFSDL